MKPCNPRRAEVASKFGRPRTAQLAEHFLSRMSSPPAWSMAFLVAHGSGSPAPRGSPILRREDRVALEQLEMRTPVSCPRMLCSLYGTLRNLPPYKKSRLRLKSTNRSRAPVAERNTLSPKIGMSPLVTFACTGRTAIQGFSRWLALRSRQAIDVGFEVRRSAAGRTPGRLALGGGGGRGLRAWGGRKGQQDRRRDGQETTQKELRVPIRALIVTTNLILRARSVNKLRRYAP